MLCSDKYDEIKSKSYNHKYTGRFLVHIKIKQRNIYYLQQYKRCDILLGKMKKKMTTK